VIKQCVEFVGPSYDELITQRRESLRQSSASCDYFRAAAYAQLRAHNVALVVIFEGL